MSKIVRLLRPALVVRECYPNQTDVLGTGSIVKLTALELMRTGDYIGELAVFFDDLGANAGWLARNTLYEAVSQKTSLQTVPHDTREALSFWDVVRGRIVRSKVLTPRQWFAEQGPKYLAELEGVIREFGGRVKKADDPQAIVRRAIRLTLLPTEDDMKADAAAAPDKASAKQKAKAKANNRAEREVTRDAATDNGGGSMAENCSAKLLPLLAKAKAPAEVVRLAQKLGKGGLTGKQLVALRDGVNEAAAEIRESKPTVAAELSAANRIVRRLARQAA